MTVENVTVKSMTVENVTVESVTVENVTVGACFVSRRRFVYLSTPLEPASLLVHPRSADGPYDGVHFAVSRRLL